jgi:hypothetical protein
VLKIFDKTVWIWKRLEWLLPWPGLSLIVVARTENHGASAVRERNAADASRL